MVLAPFSDVRSFDEINPRENRPRDWKGAITINPWDTGIVE